MVGPYDGRMRSGSGLHKTLFVCVVLIAAMAGLILAFGPNHSIGFMRLKVVNDTQRTVTIQPCWDRACLDHGGLQPVVVPPGGMPHVAGKKFPNDVPEALVVAIVRPGGQDFPPFAGCVMDTFPPGTKVAVFRVSEARVCFTSDPTGGVG